MKPIFAILGALALLSSCGTPQERCIRSATRDMQIVDRLIAESQATLSRGYALETETIYRSDFQDCTPKATQSQPNPATRMCLVQVPQTITRPKAVDLQAESATLASLEAKRAGQAALAESAIAQCRATFPA